jgi:hypothetical protein
MQETEAEKRERSQADLEMSAIRGISKWLEKLPTAHARRRVLLYVESTVQEAERAEKIMSHEVAKRQMELQIQELSVPPKTYQAPSEDGF